MENLTPSHSQYQPPNLLRRSLSREHNQIYLDLIQMGFKLEMINKVFFVYKDQNLSFEQVLTYLTTENGVWQHNYIEDNSKCFICGERTDHLNYSTPERISLNNSHNERLLEIAEAVMELFKRRSSTLSSGNNKVSVLPQSSSNIQILEDVKLNIKPNIEECPVCMCPIESTEEIHSLQCNHTFCKDCWREYIREEIHSNKDLDKIHCMQAGCEIIINEDMMNKLVFQLFSGATFKELLGKYNYFLMKQEVLKSKDKKLCPGVDCKSFGARIRDENNVLSKFVKCEYDHEFCFDCLKMKVDHRSISCEEVVDEHFEEWRKGRDVKQCPNCALWTEKNEGCNHITCVSCGYQWCWLCSQVYTVDHYLNQASPCNGRQFWRK